MKKKIIKIVIVVTVIIAFFVLLQLRNKPAETATLSIFSADPVNNSVLLDKKTTIIFSTNKEVGEDDKKNLSFQIDPKVEIDVQYLNNKIGIAPKDIFAIGETYNLKILYKSEVIYKYKFNISPFTDQQLIEEGGKQTQADLDFNDAYKDFLEKYPWYTKLPIETSEYRVVYDFEMEKFRIRLKVIPQNNTFLIDIINNALDKLKSIGVEEPINYYLLDTEGFQL